MDLLADLTDEQRDAVTHVEGPLLVLAGAGSGKTRVITRRVAYLIDQGIAPRHILAITFTNKAAGEMRERIEQLVPESRVWVSTFHKLCARLLRMYGEQVGLREGYVIYDTADRLEVIRESLKTLDIDPTHLTPDRVEHAISRAKNDLIGPDSYLEKANDYLQSHVAKVYRLYQDQLLGANAVDFDDLLLHVATLLRNVPDLRAELDQRYRFVLVDEYQDTNLAQYAILRLLSIDHPNLCATGDPDQSIYGWRGANLNNILQFESDFPGTRVVRLEKNYRSTRRILAAASHLIQFNRRRKPKDLVTDNPEGVPVRITAYADQHDEAGSIAAAIRESVESGRRSYGQFAVFCRVAALTRTLETAFATAQVPYQVLSGVGFYERAEVKNLLAYLKLLVNPRDDVAFARVVNVPSRGIGKSTLDRLQVEAARLRRPLLETARLAGQISTIKPRQAEPLAGFVRLIDELALFSGYCVEEIMRQVLARTRYLAAEGATSEFDERRANVEELLTAARQFDLVNPGGGLAQFLTESVLTTDLDAWDSQYQTVSLMTLHAAKGLEFPVVYIIAVEHGILPHQRAVQDADNDLEEERRLLFVGMTRAQEELQLSYVGRREFRGKNGKAIPSRFLLELPAAATSREEPCEARWAWRASAAGMAAASSGPTVWNDSHPPGASLHRQEAMAIRRISTAAELAGEPIPATVPPTEFREGMLVLHPAFGLGRISALSGYGERRKATVRFTTGGTRTFMLMQSPLRPVKAG